MRMRDFIRKNRRDLDATIKSCGGPKPKTDEEREEWINNKESLYLWAKRAGVILTLLFAFALPAHAWPSSLGGPHGYRPRVHSPRPHAPRPHLPPRPSTPRPHQGRG